MVVFTYGIAGGSAGTWRGGYGHQVPASGDGASLCLWNLFVFVDTTWFESNAWLTPDLV